MRHLPGFSRRLVPTQVLATLGLPFYVGLYGLWLLAAPVFADSHSPSESLSTLPEATAPPSAISPMPLLMQLERLLRQRHYQKAYALAQKHRVENEGDARFDLLYGLSAIESHSVQEALFVFERLSSHAPHHDRYRYELARCHFLLGNYPQAESLLKKLIQRPLPPEVHQAVTHYLKEAQRQSRRRRPSWTITLSGSGGYDTNTNTATDEQHIDVLDGRFTALLSDEQRALDSGYARYAGAGVFTQPITKHHQVSAHVSGNRKDNAGSDRYDIDSVSSGLEYRYRRGQTQVFLGGHYQFYWLGREGLQSRIEGQVGWNYSPSGQWQHQLVLSATQQDNRLNDDLDNWYPQISLSTQTIASRWLASARLLLSADQHNELLAKSTVGGDASLGYQATRRYQISLMLQYRFMDYHHDQPDTSLFAPGETRTEHLGQASLLQRYQLWSLFSVTGQISYIRNHSTIQIYQYDRFLMEGGLSISF